MLLTRPQNTAPTAVHRRPAIFNRRASLSLAGDMFGIIARQSSRLYSRKDLVEVAVRGSEPLRQLLAAELGIDPGAETCAVHLQILKSS